MKRRNRAGLAAAVSTVLAVGVLLAAAPSGTAGTAVPYQDPAAKGSIALCSSSGQSITSGSVSSTPFVWKAVSTAAAVAPYNGDGATATLYAFQPRENVPAGEWSGSELTAASRYSNTAHPMTAATRLDGSLADFLQAYPATWNGYVQLRMYLGAPDHPINSVSYVATDLQVTGSTWRAVDPGSASCGGGTAQSVESVLLPSTEQLASPADPPPGSAAHGSRSHTANPSSTNTSSAGAGPAAASGSAAAVAGGGGSGVGQPAADQHATSTSSHTTSIALIAVALVVILAGGYLLRRRIPAVASRSARPHVSKHTHNSQKGRRP
jgi:hypothetical protein